MNFAQAFTLLIESVEALGLLLGLYVAVDYWLDARRRELRHVAMTVVFCLGAWLVLSQGISPDNNIRFDVRFVVLMAATLFLPWQGSLTVLGAMVLWRSLLGFDAGFFASSAGSFLTWWACLWVARRFNLHAPSIGSAQRVKVLALSALVASSLPFLISFALYVVIQTSRGHPLQFSEWVPALLATALMQVVGAFLLGGLLLLQAERRRQQFTLKAFESRIKSVLDAVPDSLLVQNRQGDYVEVLSDGGSLVVPGGSGMKGRPMSDFFPADQVAERQALIEKALSERRTVEALSTVSSEEGRTSYRDLRVVPLDDQQVLVLIRDVTDNVQTRMLLHSRTEQLSLLLDNTEDLLGFLEPEGHLTCLTPKSCQELTGHSADEVSARRFDDILAGRFVRGFRNTVKSLREGEQRTAKFECAVEPPQGAAIWLDITLTALETEASKPAGGAPRLLLVARDITQRKALEFFKRMGTQAFESLKDAIVVIDEEDGRIHWANRAFERLTGYNDSQAHQQSLNELLHSTTSERPMPTTLDMVVSGQWQGEFLSQAKDGRWFSEQRFVTYFEDELSGQTFHVVVMRDLSHRKAAQQALKQLAHNDLLTGLPNRRSFLDELQEKLDRSLPDAPGAAGHGVAVVVVDIANFSAINKSLGRQVGDLALRKVAHGLQPLAPPNAAVSRVEADEFAVFVPFGSREAVEGLARGMLDFFSSPLRLQDRDVFLSGYAGIAYVETGPAQAELLLHEAHMALDDAMQKGERGIAFYDSRAAQLSQRELTIETQLRKSLAEDRDSFYLKYQPKVRLGDSTVLGVEALCRWTYADANGLTPADFIPVAERAGLIEELGLLVFESACKQIAAWTREGTPPIPVAVNLSTQQLKDEALPTKLVETSRRQGVLPSLLELEVTESDVMQDVELAVHSLQRLRRLGFKVALDDFGTGYSSMSYLQKLPLDTLKLDRSFVQSLGSDRSSEAICEAILALAQSLNLSTVAEGVETDAQRTFLASKGCGAMQGFLFSPPVSPDSLESVMAKRLPALAEV